MLTCSDDQDEHHHWHLLGFTVIPQLNLCSVHSRLATVNISNIHFVHLILFFTEILMQFLWSISSNSKKPKSTPKHDQPFYLSKTDRQSKMADLVNIYNRHVLQYNRKQCENLTYIRNLRNLKIAVIFWLHLVCAMVLRPPNNCSKCRNILCKQQSIISTLHFVHGIKCYILHHW